jgi:tetratricopeptide (TPR) repeat protein
MTLGINSASECDHLFQGFSSATLRLAQESIDDLPHDLSQCAAQSDISEAELIDLRSALIQLGGSKMGTETIEHDGQFILGKFKVFAERGRGGFGIVLQAFDPDLQRDVALKLPRPERILQGEDPEETLREARVAAKLAHPGIVPVFESGQWGPVWYIASAYCSGPSLREWIIDHAETLSARLIARLMKRICEIVVYAHSRGVLHLDLKPDNILLKENEGILNDPEPLLTDFGLARRAAFSEEACQRRAGGTVHYMAPEQRAGEEQKIGVWTDVYALGAILRDLLWAHNQTGVSLKAQSRSKSLDDLHAVARKCLADDIEQRYGSAQDVAADLDRYLRGEVLQARPIAWPPRVLRWVRRKPSLAIASMLLVVTAIASVFSIAMLWRRAEANLLQFRQEAKKNQIADQKIEESVLNLAWVAQKIRLEATANPDSYAAELDSLKTFMSEMQDWFAKRRQDTRPSPGLSAALQSLALIDEIESRSATGIERSFRDGLVHWQQLIADNPADSRWHKALAAHILTYEMQRPERTWLNWRLPGRVLLPETIKAVELNYAESLIDLASQSSGRRSFDLSHSMLQAAVKLLQSRESNQDDEPTKTRLLLTAFNLSAEAASALSRPDEAYSHMMHARKIASAIDSPTQCDPVIAYQVSQTLKTHSRELWISGKHREAIDMLALAIRYCEKSTSTGVAPGFHYRELGHLAGRMARHLKADNKKDAAATAYSQSIQFLTDGLAVLPNRPRSLVLLRATFQSELGSLLLETHQPEQAIRVLGAADRDFMELDLRRVDSKSTWFASVRTLQSLGLAYKQLGKSDRSFDAYMASLQQLNLMRNFTNHPKIDMHTRTSKMALVKLNSPTKISLINSSTSD